ncbi:MAG TPA: glycosyltransferase family 1 protein [Verrucomicrobiae bacterium]|jgi:glycosyltransferase involved in cell wall biosynthesis|nr:glycosyltransferase family 1 protein [Verrucomicrobiae bacterium]
MRIGISTSVIQRGKTGIAQYLFALLRAFLPYANENKFVLFVLEEDLPLFDFARSSMQLVPVAEKFRSPVKNILWHQNVLPRLARSLQLDVLHVPSYRRLPWSRPCPLVATIHDLAPFRVPKKYSWTRMFYGRVVARRLAQRQDAIIAISENTAQDIGQFFKVPDERIWVIHNGLEHDRFFPGSREQARAETARRHDLRAPFFLYVARLEHPAKNHVRLISAFNEFKSATGLDWQLVFGGSDWHGAETIHAAARISPFASDIRFLGFVADDELPDLYRAADAFVYPSLYEGFGMPPIEAMACGCPVICSTRGSLGEVVGDAAAIVEPDDIGSIAKQLAWLATSSDARERLRKAGLAQAKKFDWNRTAEETLSLYAGVARNSENFSPMLR